MSQATGSRHTLWQRLQVVLRRLIAVADQPDDDDDARLRKRAGVAAGYVTIVAPPSLPLAAPTPLVGWLAALGLSTFSVGNLAVLARAKRFIALISTGVTSARPAILIA